MLRDLVFAFDCERGHDEKMFQHAKDLIASMLGIRTARLFSNYINSVDGMFYLPGSAEECWKEMCEEAKLPDEDEDTHYRPGK